MPKTDWQKVGIGVGAAVLLGVGAYVLYKRLGKPSSEEYPNADTGIYPASGGQFVLPNAGNVSGYSYSNPLTGELMTVTGKTAEQMTGGQINLATKGIGTAALQVGGAVTGTALALKLGSLVAKRIGSSGVVTTIPKITTQAVKSGVVTTAAKGLSKAGILGLAAYAGEQIYYGIRDIVQPEQFSWKKLAVRTVLPPALSPIYGMVERYIK